METITNKKTTHYEVDRETRVKMIENTVGFGNIVAIAPDRKHKDCFNCLTDTGVFVVRAFDNTIITVWIASMSQAVDVWKRATGSTNLPKDLYWRIHYYYNTRVWKQATAA